LKLEHTENTKKNKINWLSILLTISSVGCVTILLLNYFQKINEAGNTIFDESLVSACAFLMLIITALMQNRDLKLQREEMEEARKVQELQKNELEENNKQIIKNIEQAKFFELQRLKEQMLEVIITNKQIDFSTIIAQLRGLYINTFLKEMIILDRKDQKGRMKRFLSASDLNTKVHVRLDPKDYLPLDKHSEDILLNQLIKYLNSDRNNFLLSLNSIDNNEGISIKEIEDIVNLDFYENIRKRLDLSHIKLYRYHELILRITNENDELRNLYESILLEEEKILFSFFENKFNIDDLYYELAIKK